MSTFRPTGGPLAGEPLPLYGGRPSAAGCNGCVDCCHLPEISVTDEEAERLGSLASRIPDLNGELVIVADTANKGWQIMRGPCPFRRLDTPLAAGGCRIYEDRPSGCEVFTCSLILGLRRPSIG